MANTVRFGNASDACGTASEKQLEVEKYDKKANYDPEKLVQCPFDKNHHIRSCRFPYHLIKCKKNHPKLASELKTCPFNARHLVPKHELAHHIETCENRISVNAEDVGGNTNGHREWQVPVSTWTNPNATEDWEQEADNNPIPFVWGVNTMLTQIHDARPTSNPDLSFRAPKNLPWSDF